jgi:hypothetical protein
VRKEWAEDANTIAAQGWLPIKFPGTTKTTTVLGLVSLCGITARPFAMTHEGYSTPQPLQMQATMQYARRVCVRLIGSGSRKRAVRKKWNGMQAVEIHYYLSTNQEPDLTGR